MHLGTDHISATKQRFMQSPLPADHTAVLRLQHKESILLEAAEGHCGKFARKAEEGMGIQIYSRDGRSAFAATDELMPEAVDDCLSKGLALIARDEGRHRVTAEALFSGPSINGQRFLPTAYGLRCFPVGSVRDAFLGFHRELAGLGSPASSTTAFSVIDEEWRILRKDGTDVHFSIPRSLFQHRVSMWSGGRNFTLPTVRVGNDCRAILDEQEKETIRRRAKARMPLLEALTTAPSVPHGSYRILIDAHLTGGLVHEAFGHAAESDAVYRGSILSDKGCFRRGMRVGPEKISIVDGPLDYDWGDQPFSADGFPRRTVTIVERGVLKEALADAFTARPIGAEPAGAERVQGYAFVPIPRMSNIRLEIEDCLPWECDFEDLSAQQLYHFLLQNHVVEPAEEVLFLSGYRGGQVNSTSGDFVFNCSLMFRLKNGQATLCAPTIFSGNIFAVLDSIRLGIGRRHLNRSGMCGKQGQKVPTSGGGPLFTLIDPHPDIRIGGR